MEQNQNQFLLPVSIIVAGIIIAGAVLYAPGTETPSEKENIKPAVEIKPIDYVELAGSLGMDTKQFKSCIQKRTFRAEVENDQQEGIGAGVQGTPTSFINGAMIDGARPFETYKTAIEAELAKSEPTASAVVKIDDDAVLGDPKAPVTMIVFGDFECPYCERAYADAEKNIREEYVATGKVKMVFRDFPLSNIHRKAVPAAEASECAHAQGKYWEYHDALFDNQDRLPLP